MDDVLYLLPPLFFFFFRPPIASGDAFKRKILLFTFPPPPAPVPATSLSVLLVCVAVLTPIARGPVPFGFFFFGVPAGRPLFFICLSASEAYYFPASLDGTNALVWVGVFVGFFFGFFFFFFFFFAYPRHFFPSTLLSSQPYGLFVSLRLTWTVCSRPVHFFLTEDGWKSELPLFYRAGGWWVSCILSDTLRPPKVLVSVSLSGSFPLHRLSYRPYPFP